MSGGMPKVYPDVWVTDRDRQNSAYKSLMDESESAVPWADAVWDDVVTHLGDADNHNRSIAAQLLCNLASHDKSGRIVGDLGALIKVTKDERFVTARHSLKSLWKIGLAGEDQRAAVVKAMAQRYQDSFDEKNGTLIRSDIVETLRQLFDAVGDPAVETTARELIEAEKDPKYQKKYAKFWK
jgi:hypothetical protein